MEPGLAILGGAALAAAMVFTTPLVGWDGSVAYNDVALAVAALATVYLLEMWRGNKKKGELTAACFLAGYCFSIKYTGVFAIFLVMGA